MEKRKNQLICLVAILVIITLFVIFFIGKNKGNSNETSINSSDETEIYTKEDQEEQLQKELVIEGDSDKQSDKLNEFIKDQETEEIKATLDKELSDQQKTALDTALKENGIELQNQETFEVSLQHLLGGRDVDGSFLGPVPGMCVWLSIVPPYNRFIKTEKNDDSLILFASSF